MSNLIIKSAFLMLKSTNLYAYIAILKWAAFSFKAGKRFVNYLLTNNFMKRIPLIAIACVCLTLLFSRCELMYALLVESGDNCALFYISKHDFRGWWFIVGGNCLWLWMWRDWGAVQWEIYILHRNVFE